MSPTGIPKGNSPVEQNESILNPADAAKQKQLGQLRPDMTIREFFEAQGMDVDRNTLMDLAQFSQKQMQNRTMPGKLRNMQGATPQAPGPQAPGPQAPTSGAPMPPSSGMEGLVNKLGG